MGVSGSSDQTPKRTIRKTNDGSDREQWHVYILRCRDHSLYTGITTNIERRLNEHNHLSSGASYTRGRRPVKLVYRDPMEDRATASREEWRIKRLTREQKEALIRSQLPPSKGDR